MKREYVSLILHLSIHRDRFRTTINVMCDALGTILVNQLSKKDLSEADHKVSR